MAQIHNTSRSREVIDAWIIRLKKKLYKIRYENMNNSGLLKKKY